MVVMKSLFDILRYPGWDLTLASEMVFLLMHTPGAKGDGPRNYVPFTRVGNLD